MRRYTVTLFLLAPVALAMAAAPCWGEIYKWVDETGQTHYADSIRGVPEKYRGQTETKHFRPQQRSTVRSMTNGARQTATPAGHGGSGALKKFEVPYKAYQGTARRIIIPVRFNGSVTAPMILDTGAPEMLITPELAAKIGLFDKDNGKLLTQSGGVGGTVPSIRTIVDSIQVGGARTEFVPTTVAPFSSGPFEGLVGMDFVANYSVTIDTRKHVVVFQELEPRANMPAGHDRAWWVINFRNFASMRSNWKGYYDKISKEYDNTSRMKKILNLAKSQYKQSDILFRKLEDYASRNSVPMHWRKY